MIKKNINLLLYILVIVCSFAFLIGCASKGVGGEVNEPEQPAATIFTEVYKSYVFTTSYPQLAETSELIIIGRPVTIGATINMARDPSDPSNPDSDLFGIGQVYTVVVEQYLEGSGEQVVKVVQAQGHVNTESGPPTAAEIEQARAEDQHIPLHMGARYLMFLAPTFRLSNGEYFSGVGHPWRFVISRNGCVYVEDIFAEKLVRYFPPQPLESVLKELEKPYDPSSSQGGLPYPPPAPSNFCSPKPLPGPYPYPAP